MFSRVLARGSILAGLQGEEHGPHAAGHRGPAEEQQECLHRRPDRHPPSGHVPLVRAAGLLQGGGGLPHGRQEIRGEEEW